VLAKKEWHQVQIALGSDKKVRADESYQGRIWGPSTTAEGKSPESGSLKV
jgi:hypothetical protein